MMIGSTRARMNFISAACALIATTALAQTPPQWEQQRNKLVDECIVAAGVKDSRVIDAMRKTPRHEFCLQQHRKNAYLDMALPIGDQQTISSPFIVAYMTEALQPKATDVVLEIGTGSGFQAAVLSPLVKEVYSIEIVEPLGERAARTLKRLGYKNVFTKIGDGYQGWEEHAPFDKIIVTCSPEKVPQPLVDQLREGGQIIVPVGERYQQTLYRMTKKDGKLEAAALLPTLFVPMTGAAEDRREVKPDPAHPSAANGSFEEQAFPSGAQPGWYYERGIKWVEGKDAPDGDHYVTFQNSESGLSTHLLQGFGIDGRQVGELQLFGWVKTKDVKVGAHRDELPAIVVTLYDSERKELGHWIAGPVRGDTDWHEQTKTIQVPTATREGILRIGLFGATGTASFDKIRLQRKAGK